MAEPGRVEFAMDSPLEGRGFEPPVPPNHQDVTSTAVDPSLPGPGFGPPLLSRLDSATRRYIYATAGNRQRAVILAAPVGAKVGRPGDDERLRSRTTKVAAMGEAG